MTPMLTFFIGLTILVLFGWYFASEGDRLRRILGTVLTIVVTAFCLWSTYPPFDEKRPDGTVIRHGKIHLGLDLQGGTSFLIRLEPPASADGGKRPITKAMVDQAIEAIRKRVDRFGVSEPIITPQGNDRILVQIPGLDAANIQEARDQLSRVAKLEFRLVYPDNGQRLKAIDEGKEVIPPEYRIETYKQQVEGGKPIEERLLVRKKADLGGNHVSQAAAGYGQEGWEVTLRFDAEGAKTFGQITEANVNHRFAIVLDGVIQSAPVIKTAIYGGNAVISGGRMDEPEARNLASVFTRNFPDLMVEYIHFPQNMTSPHTIDYMVSEYKRLNASYEQLSGKKITDEALRQSIALYNTQRRLLRELYAIRRETPQNLSTVECYVLTRIGTLLPPEEHIAILEEAIPAVRQRNEKPKDRIRVVLEGSFCEQPPIELLDGLESAGCYILDDDFLIGWRWFSEDISTAGDPMRNLANAYLNHSVYSGVKHDTREPKSKHLIDKFKETGAAAVLILAAKFCEPALFDYALYKRALEKEGIPHLCLEFEEKMWIFDKARSEVETFVESMLFD